MPAHLFQLLNITWSKNPPPPIRTNLVWFKPNLWLHSTMALKAASFVWFLVGFTHQEPETLSLITNGLWEVYKAKSTSVLLELEVEDSQEPPGETNTQNMSLSGLWPCLAKRTFPWLSLSSPLQISVSCGAHEPSLCKQPRVSVSPPHF